MTQPETRTLAIFGITGRTGQVLACAALARGWSVRGFTRPGSPVPAMPGAISIVRGDFAEAARLEEAVAGADAVCCVFGPRPPYADAFCAGATQAIVGAMRQSGVRRLVCQTGAMVGTGNRTPVFEFLARRIAGQQPAAAHDRVEQERLVQASGLEWTLVKPPRLTDGPAGHRAIAGPALRVGLLSRISRADVAAFILDAIEGTQYLRARVFVRG